MVTKVNTTTVPKNAYKSFAEKADQFFNVMNICLNDREWDAVLLNGVHAAIAINDALCIFLLGLRSTSKMHQDSVRLLIQAVPTHEGKKNAVRLAEILNIKHKVEYESRRFIENEARRFAVQVDRFKSWAEKQLPH